MLPVGSACTYRMPVALAAALGSPPEVAAIVTKSDPDAGTHELTVFRPDCMPENRSGVLASELTPLAGAGEKGDTGEPGPKGDKGDAGEQGPKGDQGDKGDTGTPAATLSDLDASASKAS